jgi:drug/metabolite transporter (DMT)-like permease
VRDEKRGDDSRRAVGFGLGAVGLWSTVATAFEIALDHLSGLQLLWISAFTSWLLLGGLLVYTKQGRLALWTGWRRAAIAGLLNPLAYYLILFSAYSRLPGQEAMVLNYTWALTMSLLAVPMLGHKLKSIDIGAAFLAYLGVWTIATRGSVFTLGFADGTGVGLALASTLLWALYWLLSARDPRPPVVAQWQNFSVALPILTLLMVAKNGWMNLPHVGLGAALYVGVFEMGVAFLLWQEAVRRTKRTSQIANLIFLSPPVSLVLLHLIRGEELALSTIVGLVFILLGLALQNFSKREA